MKAAPALLVLLALALGFGLGRATAPRSDAELSTAESLRWALEDPDWLSRTYRLSAFLQQLSPENLPAVLETLEPQIPWLVTDEIRLLMFAWSRFDAPGALEHALSWPPRYRRNASGAAIYAWAFRDPEGAVQALDALDDPELTDFMRARLIAGWAHGPQKSSASEYIASLPQDPRRLNYAGTLAGELARQGPDAVVHWAEGVPDGDSSYKADVFLQASAALAALDPASTAEWLEPHLTRGYARGALEVVARSWAALDPAAALRWLASPSPDPHRKRAVFEAFGVWLDTAPEEAERWLRSATPASPFDPAVRVLVSRNRREAPAVALEWAMTIHDPELGEQLVVDVGRGWMRRDAAAARVWLAQSALPDALREAVLESRAGEDQGPAGETGTAVESARPMP